MARARLGPLCPVFSHVLVSFLLTLLLATPASAPQLFFLYVPRWAVAGLAAALYATWQIRKLLAARREKRLQKLDEKAIQEILGVADEETETKRRAEQAKAKKAKTKVHQRLAQERKAEGRSGGGAGEAAAGKSKKKGGAREDDEEDENDLLKFAKGSRQQAKSKGQ
jgi:uncharacterized protein HemX